MDPLHLYQSSHLLDDLFLVGDFQFLTFQEQSESSLLLEHVLLEGGQLVEDVGQVGVVQQFSLRKLNEGWIISR